MIDYPEGLPCWAPGAADRLAEMLTGDEVGLEWGGGASSVWLAQQVQHLHVIEHDPKWVDWIRARVHGSRVMVHEAPWQGAYYVEVPRLIAPRPSLWLIDGFRRIDCLIEVRKMARSGDIVVLDDALDYGAALMDAVPIERFQMPHPYAGTPITSPKHKEWRNTELKAHPLTKETWLWQVD